MGITLEWWSKKQFKSARLCLYKAGAEVKSTSQWCMFPFFSGTDHMLALMESGKVLSWGTGGQGQLGRITKAEFQELSRAKHKFKMLQQEIENIEEKIKEAEDNAKAKLEQELAGVRPNFESASRLYKPLEKQMRQNQLTPKEVNIPARWSVICHPCHRATSLPFAHTQKVYDDLNSGASNEIR